MTDLLVLARVGLAAMFIIAGIAKGRDLGGTRAALSEFGVPRQLIGPAAVLLSGAELATAAGLVFAGTARWGAIAALVLLAVFVIGLTRALRRGETPDCHCFGQVHSSPASWITVARNVALVLPSVYVVAAGPGPSLASWVTARVMRGLWLIAVSSLAAGTTATSLVLWRANRRLSAANKGVPAPTLRIGAPAPQFSLPSINGDVVHLRDLLVDERLCLVTFVHPLCGPCRTLLPELARWQETLAHRLRLPVVTAGGAGEVEELAREYGLPQVLSDAHSKVSRAFGVPGTPCAVLIASDGTVKSSPAAGQVAIEALVRLALEEALPPAMAATVT